MAIQYYIHLYSSEKLIASILKPIVEMFVLACKIQDYYEMALSFMLMLAVISISYQMQMIVSFRIE